MHQRLTNVQSSYWTGVLARQHSSGRRTRTAGWPAPTRPQAPLAQLVDELLQRQRLVRTTSERHRVEAAYALLGQRVPEPRTQATSYLTAPAGTRPAPVLGAGKFLPRDLRPLGLQPGGVKAVAMAARSSPTAVRWSARGGRVPHHAGLGGGTGDRGDRPGGGRLRRVRRHVHGRPCDRRAWDHRHRGGPLPRRAGGRRAGRAGTPTYCPRRRPAAPKCTSAPRPSRSRLDRTGTTSAFGLRRRGRPIGSWTTPRCCRWDRWHWRSTTYGTPQHVGFALADERVRTADERQP